MRALVLLAACSGAPPPHTESAKPVAADAAIANTLDAAIADAAPTSLLVPDASTRGRIVVTESDHCGFILDFLYFESGSAEIGPRQQPIIDETATMLACGVKDEGISKIEVQGHADDKEKDAMRLSEQRAVTVANALVSKGVPAKVLVPVGYGSAFPLDKRKTAAARAKNRRAGFLILERKPD